MRVLVTGGAGQVGACVAPLLPAGAVTAPAHDELDITDEPAVAAAIDASGAEVVLNCAAYTDVDGCERDPERATAVNATGAGAVARAAAAAGVRLVHVSTDYVFDGRATRPYRPDDPVNPLSVYGRSKLAGERAVADAGGDAVVVRTAWVFGKRGKDFVSWVLSVEPGAPLRVVADQVGAPTYAPDLAAALVELGAASVRGVVHVTNGGSCSRFEFARDILAAAGRDPSVVTPITTADLPRPAARPAYSVLDGSSATAAGVSPLRHYRGALAQYLGGAGTRPGGESGA